MLSSSTKSGTKLDFVNSTPCLFIMLNMVLQGKIFLRSSQFLLQLFQSSSLSPFLYMPFISSLMTISCSELDQPVELLENNFLDAYDRNSTKLPLQLKLLNWFLDEQKVFEWFRLRNWSNSRTWLDGVSLPLTLGVPRPLTLAETMSDRLSMIGSSTVKEWPQFQMRCDLYNKS